MNKTAFTLAEVLITLAIIGVVAAITMPVLMTNINERVNSERQANIVYKINQAMEHMRATGKLTAYDSTESFVNELQKHLKISKVCDKDHIQDCWPTERVTTGLGEELLIKDVKTGENLMLETGTNNVGLILADGASIILNYDNSFEGMDIGAKVEASPIGLPNGNGKSKVYLQYTTNLMSPLAFVMDVNGKKGPNSETIDGKYHDIRSFGGARLSNACAGDYYNGTCVYYIGTAYSNIDCLIASQGGTNTESEEYAKYCGSGSYRGYGGTSDYWAGARKACDIIGMKLPTVSELQSINQDKTNYPTIATNSGYFWTSDEYEPTSSRAMGVYFNNGVENSYHKDGKYQVLCIQ